MTADGEGNLNIPVVLTIAGTDPSGGAGINADLKTFTAFQCFGASAVTAVVSQNTQGVGAIHALPPAFVERQIKDVLDDMKVSAIKTGMLFDENITRSVVNSITEFYSLESMPPLVVDPVCVSTSGHTLLDPEALGVMITELFPLATIITPNRQEAEQLLAWNSEATRKIDSLEAMLLAVQDLSEMGPKNVLIKGGHMTCSRLEVDQFRQQHPDVVSFGGASGRRDCEVLKLAENILFGSVEIEQDEELVIDMLYERTSGSTSLFIRRRLSTSSTHGTGCTLSAALVCGFGIGKNVLETVLSATEYTHLAISTAPGLGKGNGPLNHMHRFIPRSVPVRTSPQPFPFTSMLIDLSSNIWKEYVEHAFVKDLGKGILAPESFKRFIKQDYIYLKYYARAFGLFCAKATDYSTIASSAEVILHVARESEMHVAFCESWGISRTELESTPEHPITAAYGGYLLNIGVQGDLLKLDVAFMACLVGYGEVGLWLVAQARKTGSAFRLEGNPYRKWIDDYSGDTYQTDVRNGIEQLEAMVERDPPSTQRFGELCEVWETCTKFEKEFWDMAFVRN